MHVYLSVNIYVMYIYVCNVCILYFSSRYKVYNTQYMENITLNHKTLGLSLKSFLRLSPSKYNDGFTCNFQTKLEHESKQGNVNGVNNCLLISRLTQAAHLSCFREIEQGPDEDAGHGGQER